MLLHDLMDELQGTLREVLFSQDQTRVRLNHDIDVGLCLQNSVQLLVGTRKVLILIDGLDMILEKRDLRFKLPCQFILSETPDGRIW